MAVNKNGFFPYLNNSHSQNQHDERAHRLTEEQLKTRLAKSKADLETLQKACRSLREINKKLSSLNPLSPEKHLQVEEAMDLNRRKIQEGETKQQKIEQYILIICQKLVDRMAEMQNVHRLG